MARIVVTGGAGFLGSHLCVRCSTAATRWSPSTTSITGSVANIEELFGQRGFTFVEHDVSQYVWVPGERRRRDALRQPRVAGRLRADPDPDPQGRRTRHAQLPRARQGQGRPLLPRLDERGLRRPAGPSAAGDLLGQRQPDRPAGRVRRGQALRRGDDDGVPPSPRPRRADRAHFQHLRAAQMRPDDGRAVSNFLVQALQGKPITVFGDGRQTRWFCYVDDEVRGFLALLDSDLDRPGEHRQPRRVHDPPAGRARRRGHRLVVVDRVRAAARRRSDRSASPTSRSPATGSAGRRRCRCVPGSSAPPTTSARCSSSDEMTAVRSPLQGTIVSIEVTKGSDRPSRRRPLPRRVDEDAPRSRRSRRGAGGRGPRRGRQGRDARRRPGPPGRGRVARRSR